MKKLFYIRNYGTNYREKKNNKKKKNKKKKNDAKVT